MTKIRWTPQAINDLDNILDYISDANMSPNVAIKIHREMKDRIHLIAMKNEAGHHHHLTSDSWRYILFKRWLVFFRRYSWGIEIQRVIDASRDLPKHL
jgi:Plasmid stabilization system protein